MQREIHTVVTVFSASQLVTFRLKHIVAKMKWFLVVCVSVLSLLCQVVHCDVIVKHGPKINLVDLTQVTHEDIPKHPVFTGLKRTVNVFRYQDIVKVKIEEICLPTHYGTHMDAPCHVSGTWCLGDIPLERLLHVPAAVIDIRHRIFDGDNVINADYGVTVEDMENWEKVNGQIPEDALILLLTGWPRFWNDSAKYLGGDSASNTVSPGLGKEAAEWIITKRPSVVGVGIDTVTVDRGLSQTLEAHVVLTAQNVYHLENLVNLDKLPAKGATVTVGVLKLGREASGGPARVYASFNN